MTIQDFELVGSYNNQRFPNIDAERSINLFEYIDMKGKKPRSLISTSGLQNTHLVFEGTVGGFRAEFVLEDFEYFVIGQDIWRRDAANILTKLNAGFPLPDNAGYVGVDANNNPNGSQILFVDGKKGYIWDTGNSTFTFDVKTIAPDFPEAPIDVCFIDGFLLVAHGGTNQFQLSGFNDAYSWGSISAKPFTADASTDELAIAPPMVLGQSFELTGVPPPPELASGVTYYAIPIPLDPLHIRIATSYANALAGIYINFTVNGAGTITWLSGGAPGQLQQAQINTHPGHIVGCRTLHRRVFLFSENYTEVWENAGTGYNLPLRRNNALLIENGTPSRGSIVASFDKLMFLAQDKDGLGSVMQVIGTEPIPVSNRALDFQLAQYAEKGQVSDARGIFVKENGIIFYRLNFTAANHTFVYNVTLSNPQTEEGRLWHEEEVLNGDRHPAQTHGYFKGNNFYGHYSSPILYQVDSTFVTNDGETIPRIRIGRAFVSTTYNRIRTDRFMVDIIQGLAEVTSIDESQIDLVTESENILQTESGLDIIIESSGVLIYNPDDHVIYLSISKNGGVSFDYRQAATVGAIGDRKHRTVWRKLGVIPRGQGFVPKLEFYGNISLIILGAAWAFEVMPE